MEQAFSRTELLLGSSALERLAASRVAVFGIGGVGGYVCEALARTGVGHLDLIDSDTVAVSNINRQIIATTKTVGQYKTDAMEARILDINPAAKITKHNCFFLPETAADFPFNQYDYVVDAVDTMSAKLALVTHCHAAGVPIICAMGAGNKLDPTGFQVADLVYRPRLLSRIRKVSFSATKKKNSFGKRLSSQNSYFCFFVPKP